MQKKAKSPATVTRISSARARRKVEWQLLSGGELARPGATLMNLILAAASDREISPKEIGKQALGIGYSYFSQLRNGEKEIAKLGDESIIQAAAFLRMPKVAVLVAAGQLKLEDFYTDPATFHEFLLPALKHIQRDPELGPYVPASIFNADPKIQQCLVLLYERATGRSLIPGKVSNEAIAERHRSLVQGKNLADSG